MHCPTSQVYNKPHCCVTWWHPWSKQWSLRVLILKLFKTLSFRKWWSTFYWDLCIVAKEVYDFSFCKSNWHGLIKGVTKQVQGVLKCGNNRMLFWFHHFALRHFLKKYFSKLRRLKKIFVDNSIKEMSSPAKSIWTKILLFSQGLFDWQTTLWN